jgi:hypothetical protein
LPLLFAVTLFLGAALLFWVQPMFARLVLPLLGGTPAVWNTCMVFFQAALLLGYGYAHLTTAYLGVRRQALLHLGLILLPLAVLPIAVPEGLGQHLDYAHPALGLLLLLLLGVGLPFFVVATTAPLLQRWFAATGHGLARDPYFLYAASNLGSMVGLLSYPFLLEPLLPLDEQSNLWTYGYGALVLGSLACAGCVVRGAWRVAGGEQQPPLATRQPPPAGPPPSAFTRFRWVALAFVPSSLMLSVTTYLTTDVAPMPLLWVLPLALYLLTFILAFARRSRVPLRALNRGLPLLVEVVLVVLLSEATHLRALPIGALMGIHLFALFAIALFCHGELARSRPTPQYLTEFYLWLSVGGVLGGLFNALVAPLVFRGIAEYPLVLVLACLFRFREPAKESARPGQAWSRAAATPQFRFTLLGRSFVVDRSDVLLPVAVGVLTLLLVLVGRSMGVPGGPLSVAVIFSVPLVICYTFLERPLRFALGLGALLLASSLAPSVYGDVVYRHRSFFGVVKVLKVTDKYEHHYRRLVNGNTIHGEQDLADPHRPLTYYHRDGPAGQLFKFLDESGRRPHDVGVVGLGAGTLAAYGQPGQAWTFYEIDPAVVYIARDSGLFTFLEDCPARKNIVEGDARLRLAATRDCYDLLIIDAFSSDALPVHLFTRQALQVYLARLRDKGVLAFHVSSRYLDLSPVLAELARDAGLGCWIQSDPEDAQHGKFASDWVVMGRPAAPLEELVHTSSRWQRLRGGTGRALWTDDFCSLLGLLR